MLADRGAALAAAAFAWSFLPPIENMTARRASRG